jgi:hypothetical protein
VFWEVDRPRGNGVGEMDRPLSKDGRQWERLIDGGLTVLKKVDRWKHPGGMTVLREMDRQND